MADELDFASFAKQFGGEPVASPAPSSAASPVLSSIAATHRNPGNIRDPVTGDYKTYNTDEEGFEGLVGDITAKQTGKTRTGLHSGSTLYDFTNVYAPKADKNDPVLYAQNLGKQLGVPPETSIGAIHPRDFAAAIAHQEDGPYWNSIQSRIMGGAGDNEFASFAKQFGGVPVAVSQPPLQQPPPSGYRKAPIPAGLQGKPDADLDKTQRALDPIGYFARKYYTDPVVSDVTAGVKGLQNPSTERKLHGLHQVGTGVARAALPFAIPGAVASPGIALASGALGYGAQQVVDKSAEQMKVPQGYREVAGDAAALIAGGVPAAIRSGSGLAGKVVRHGIGRIPYVGKPIVSMIDAAIADKAAVEAAAAKAAAAKAKPEAGPKPATRAEIDARELSRQSVAKQNQPTTNVPPRDTGVSGWQGPSPPEATGPAPFNPPPPPPTTRATEAIRRPISRQNQPGPGVEQPAYQETWPDYGEATGEATGPPPTPPPVEVEGVPPVPVKPSARTKALTRFGGKKEPFDEGASGLGARKPYVEKPPEKTPEKTPEADTTTTTPATTHPPATKSATTKPNAKKAAQAYKEAVTGKGGGGVETIKSTQPSSAELARANKIANGHNKYLTPLTGGRITADQVYRLTSAQADAMEAQIAAAKSKQLMGQAEGGVMVPPDLPDPPVHFKMGGMVVPDEPNEPNELGSSLEDTTGWAKLKFNRIFSADTTSQYAQKVADITGSRVAKRTRQLSADNRTFLNFVKTELNTHDPQERVAWVMPEGNADVLASWVANGARNNLDLGSKHAHTKAIERLHRSNGRVVLDSGSGPGIYIITEQES